MEESFGKRHGEGDGYEGEKGVDYEIVFHNRIKDLFGNVKAEWTSRSSAILQEMGIRKMMEMGKLSMVRDYEKEAMSRRERNPLTKLSPEEENRKKVWRGRTGQLVLLYERWEERVRTPRTVSDGHPMEY